MWWFLTYIDMNQPQVYMCPPSENEISIPRYNLIHDYIFYDKYIIKNGVFLYAFRRRESENAKISIEKSAF